MSIEKYLNMQRQVYDHSANQWSLGNKDPVVGSYAAHNKWADYDLYLFKGFDTRGLVALEYGCGPGRNIIRFAGRFERIDGVDISQVCLDKAKINLTDAKVNIPLLMLTDGSKIPCPDASYDVVFSVICMQHICVHDIRDAILKEMYRVLKPGGYVCIQMGYGGKPYTQWLKYEDNFYDANETNGTFDVSVTSEQQVKEHLERIGFKNFKADVRPVGPGDWHRNWIWFQGQK